VDRFGRVAERRDGICVPTYIHHSAIAMQELLLERPRGRLLDPALDLVAHALGIHRLSRIDDAPHLDQPNRSGERHLYLRDLGHVRVVVDSACDTPTAPIDGTFLPAAPLGDAIDDASEAIVREVSPSEV